MTIGEQVKARLNKEGTYRRAQLNPDSVDREAVAAELVALHKRAFDTGTLSDDELSRAAECVDLLHGCGAIRGFDEAWDVLTQVAVARIQVADLDAARGEYNSCAAAGRDYCTPHELREADSRFRLAVLARDTLKELGLKYSLLVGLDTPVASSS